VSELSRTVEITQAALLLPTAEIRAAFLDAMCGQDAELRDRVESRLVQVEVATTRSQQVLPIQVAGPTHIEQDHTHENEESMDPVIRERMGTIIGGRYTLVCELGHGGMGTVWLAEQTSPILRRVAVKLIKPELVSSRVLARFDAERQALALMDHPNIAKVFDAGTTVSGRPFFVMELVEGTNLTDFCDARRLTIRQRIELFIQVCRAIQHAHQKGIIHRDLKPSNILVSAADGVPVPKVIDFGLAKAIGTGLLGDSAKSSTLGRIVGTTLYMSPEQASGAKGIDTRTDVYALGVVLYELLSGTTPIEPMRLKQTNSLEQVINVICNESVILPSERSTIAFQQTQIAPRRQTNPKQLKESLQGELDLIILKALAKSPEDRYAGVAEFEAELTRYLNQEPILILSGSRWYRLQKYARRNRTTLVTITIALLALLIGLASSTWGMVQAIQTRDAALDSEQRAVHKLHELEQSYSSERQAHFTAIDQAKQLIKIREEQVNQLKIRLQELEQGKR
jgi:eukaryotic-like serine/threonine-protein kinase